MHPYWTKLARHSENITFKLLGPQYCTGPPLSPSLLPSLPPSPSLSPSLPLSLSPNKTDGFRECASCLLASSHNWDYSGIIRLIQPCCFCFCFSYFFPFDFGSVCDVKPSVPSLDLSKNHVFVLPRRLLFWTIKM